MMYIARNGQGTLNPPEAPHQYFLGSPDCPAPGKNMPKICKPPKRISAFRRGDVMEWQPIETAPRDGSRFLAFEYDSDGSMVCYSCHCNNGWFVASSIGDTDYYADPIYWMPHPDAPTGSTI